jgi:hypothetical protein
MEIPSFLSFGPRFTKFDCHRKLMLVLSKLLTPLLGKNLEAQDMLERWF